MIKKCKFCGKEFEAKTKLKKYCCQSCRERAQVAANSEYRERKKAARGRTKQCVMCGAEFEPVFRNRKYCSEECAKKAVADMKKSLREERKKAEEVADKRVQLPSPETALGRYLRMSLREVSAECARLHLTYGQVQVMAEKNSLPRDFGLERRKKSRNEDFPVGENRKGDFLR